MGASYSVRKQYEAKRDAARLEFLEGPGIVHAGECTDRTMAAANVDKGFHRLPNGQCVEILPGAWPS